MKKLLASILLIAFILPQTVFGAQAFFKTWTTVLSKIPQFQANFTVTATTTDTNLRYTTFGGTVTDIQADDLVWYSDSSCTTKLNYDRELYASTTGQVVDHILLPQIYATTTVTMYMCWGDTSITTYQGSGSSAYDSSHVGVWHMQGLNSSTTPERPSATLIDSISNNNLAKTSSTRPLATTSAQIDGSQAYSASTVDIASKVAGVTAIPGTNASQTVQLWYVESTNDAANHQAIDLRNNTTAGSLSFQRRSGNTGWYVNGGGTIIQIANPTINSRNFAALTWNGTTNIFYNNAASTTNTTAHDNTTVDRIRFSTFDSALEAWNGIIDEVRISSVVRSPSWMTTVYNNQVSVGQFFTISTAQTLGGAFTPAIPRLIVRSALQVRSLMIIR